MEEYAIKCLLSKKIVDKTPRTFEDAKRICDKLTRNAHIAGLFDMNYEPVLLTPPKV